MNIYISGISGTGMGALAELARDAGHQVFGSDLAIGSITNELIASGIQIEIGSQDGTFLRSIHADHPIDYFIHTASLPAEHPELLLAKKLSIKTGKREKLVNLIIKDRNLKLIAVSGTHGKTTTTALIIWIMQQLGIPISYLVGSTLPFGPAGKHQPGSEYFIYEADEFDRNFINFHPFIAVIPSATYDHPDTYPTQADYDQAFAVFRSQSQRVIENLPEEIPGLTLPGKFRRHDASLAITAVQQITSTPIEQLVDIANHFPGVGRRFENISTGVYSDYAHHPEEISVTISMAQELVARDHHKGLVVIYEPHQNTRQHAVKHLYADAFSDLASRDQLFWLPTFLTREDQSLPLLTPAELSHSIANSTPAHPDDTLATELKRLQADNFLILLMTAGPADTWLRTVFPSTP